MPVYINILQLLGIENDTQLFYVSLRSLGILGTPSKSPKFPITPNDSNDSNAPNDTKPDSFA